MKKLKVCETKSMILSINKQIPWGLLINVEQKFDCPDFSPLQKLPHAKTLHYLKDLWQNHNNLSSYNTKSHHN